MARDAHPESCSLTDGLGGEEVFEQTAFHLVAHAGAVVGNGDDKTASRGSDADADFRGIAVARLLRLHPHGIAGIADHVQHGAAEILRDDLHERHVRLILLADGDIETRMAGSHGVIRKADVFPDNAAHI